MLYPPRKYTILYYTEKPESLQASHIAYYTDETSTNSNFYEDSILTSHHIYRLTSSLIVTGQLLTCMSCAISRQTFFRSVQAVDKFIRFKTLSEINRILEAGPPSASKVMAILQLRLKDTKHLIPLQSVNLVQYITSYRERFQQRTSTSHITQPVRVYRGLSWDVEVSPEGRVRGQYVPSLTYM